MAKKITQEIKAKVGDTIQWSFPVEGCGPYLAGKTFTAEVVLVMENGDCGVYAEYGQDYIPQKDIEKIIK